MPGDSAEESGRYPLDHPLRDGPHHRRPGRKAHHRNQEALRPNRSWKHTAPAGISRWSRLLLSCSPQEPPFVYCRSGDTQVAKFQLFGSLLILTGYRLFLNPYRKVSEVPLQVRW